MNRIRDEFGVTGFVLVPELDGFCARAPKLLGTGGRARMQLPEVRSMLRAVLVDESEALRKLGIVDVHGRFVPDLATEMICHLTEPPVEEVDIRLRSCEIQA